MGLAQEFIDAVHELRADAFQRHFRDSLAALLSLRIFLAHGFLVCRELRPIGLHQAFQRSEMARQDLGYLLAHARDA
jgi:hypothetical protein